ncbi:MAG: hypothetical protein HYR76_10475 [Ignavibacteria bacterium]|nr:hypothetical protein [Ignavibacteria bacterium]
MFRFLISDIRRHKQSTGRATQPVILTAGAEKVIHFDLRCTPDRRDQTENDTGVVRRDESNDRSWSGALGASWSVLHYLSDDGFHLMTRLSSGVSGSYSKLNLVTNRSQAQTSEEEIRKSYSLHFQGSLAIGYGRIRDGSFIYRALRVVERLREDGVVNRQLSRSEMLDLADRLARRRDYTTNFERYEKYFVQDIIAELAERGALGSQQLTGLSTLKIVEALRQDIQSRLFGWRVYYAFNDTHDQSRSDGQTIVAGSSAVGYDQFNNDWIYVHEVGAEFGYPFSLFTHLYSKFKVELPNHHYDTRFFMRLTTTLTHEIGERVELGGSVDFTNGSGSVYSYDVDQYTRATSYTISGNFVYFLEDQLRFITSMSYGNYRSDGYGVKPPYFPASYTSSGFSFSFGLTYNII